MQPSSWLKPSTSFGWIIFGFAVLADVLQASAKSDRLSSLEAWRTSPFHAAISGATGLPIPCLCRFRGHDFPVGERVCMQTLNGIVVTRCDLFQNNTTWVPTDEPCTLSRAPVEPHQNRKS